MNGWSYNKPTGLPFSLIINERYDLLWFHIQLVYFMSTLTAIIRYRTLLAFARQEVLSLNWETETSRHSILIGNIRTRKKVTACVWLHLIKYVLFVSVF